MAGLTKLEQRRQFRVFDQNLRKTVPPLRDAHFALCDKHGRLGLCRRDRSPCLRDAPQRECERCSPFCLCGAAIGKFVCRHDCRFQTVSNGKASSAVIGQLSRDICRLYRPPGIGAQAARLGKRGITCNGPGCLKRANLSLTG